ncbi:tolB protein precursor [Marinilongibacter aquaticus]|uniref:tolB protein precursor n=1 Tax=Marinilongibacter aquaticus TaxID=2975157 RepID=UPI0021BD90FB|nr:tolB protein precursor [Marinilongibacter aquaticus]UBM59621.1 tolB protein precursor [Marinilongibacter aquaticus]
MKRLQIGFFLLIALHTLGQSQYFGQNKPRYKQFDFKVLNSPHFELYHYFDEQNVPNALLSRSEHWYDLHQKVFKLAFIEPNPLIVYKNHPDFQETTAISGMIGQGTGGVTEGIKNRVVMPMMFTNRQTDHVLGHELVHAFQYKTMVYGAEEANSGSIANLPLFMVEGLAEYMSLGREDSHTAMWMRDAVLHDDIPSLEDMVSKQYKYFPYRWGQAFWAYTTATYGDDVIRPLFKETAKMGYTKAIQSLFKIDDEVFSARFKKALKEAYLPLKEERAFKPLGTVIASKVNGGEMNLSPSLSPDGKLIAYISSKDVLSIDILIANAETGEVLHKIKSASFGSSVDDYNFIETAGTWSPDSRFFALVIQAKGRDKLSVINVRNGSKKTFVVKGVDALANPAWSPKDNKIVLSGLVEGQSDLFLFDLKSRAVERLTNDMYSDIQPTWSPDGQSVFFVSDRNGQNADLAKSPLSIAKMDLATKKIESLALFGHADNMNPLVSGDGQNLYFLSNQDGFRDLYAYNFSSRITERLTKFYTGVSGITAFSPAVSLSTETGELTYTYFENNAYAVVKARPDELLHEKVEQNQKPVAGLLPPFEFQSGRNLVEQSLENGIHYTPENAKDFSSKKFTSKFKLDYVANSGLGMSTSYYGTGLGGGVMAQFSDMLSDNILAGTVAISGSVQNFGGQIYYINQKRPFQFGASVAHIPYQFYGGYKYAIEDTLSQGGGIDYYNGEYSQIVHTLFIDQLSVFGFKPFSKAKRIEFGASLSFYSFSVREYPQYGQLGIGDNGYLYSFNPLQNLRPRKLDPEDFGYTPFQLNSIYTALVGDQTTFGTVAPLNGYRYRFQLSQYFGSVNFTQVLADLRKYVYLKPVTLAGRLMYNGRLNPSNTDFLNQINPLFLGFPWYMHGFYGKAFTKQQESISTDALRGDQMALANFEVRLPFTGPKKIALLPIEFLPSDLNFYVDCGLVWSQQKPLGGIYQYETYGNQTIDFKSTPVVTTGLSLRINVLGFLIVEPYMAVPFYNGGQKPVVSGMNFMIPGW